MKLNKNNRKTRIKKWSIKNSHILLEDHWIKVRADDCITGDGVIISPYYVLEYPNWVHTVVINNKDEVLIVEQYRHGAGNIFFELPCGIQDKKDGSPLEAARRELMEETGYTGDFVFVGKTYPNPASHSNSIYTFLVTNPVKYFHPQNNPAEILDYQFIDIERVLAMVDKGKFGQALHISSLTLGLRKLKTL